MLRFFSFAVVLLLAVSDDAYAGGRDALQAFTRGLKGLDGHFTQQVYDEKGKRKESSNGRVTMAVPRLFRWEYLKPFPQLIVADGAKVWVYDPDLKQVTVRAQGEAEQNSPLAALIDPQRLDRDFDVREVADADGLQWLELIPKQADQASFAKARLGFGKQGLTRMRIIDALGQRTDVEFSGWKRNPAFTAKMFRFSVPKGVDVVKAD
ncbi:MAG: outer membrane lipoprotein chaperone LolA [Lysobacteraceae bacterium]|nr:MAG: outer membrane lipoprotein chaperone LolA [Xanthomonadaceae bacterium]